ncbi:MAG: nucleoside hydrolase [Rhodobacteraceae bacterium]|nr:nucleoside hydrolase [Paracoccaceae bacterium]
MDPVKIILDTDPGIDDAMAFFQAIGDPKIDLVGMTTIFGNVTVDIATRNAFRLANMVGREIPVARGAEQPLDWKEFSPSSHVHGDEGFGDIAPIPVIGTAHELSADAYLVDTCAKNPGEITICAIGPLTNLALALRRDPNIVNTVKRVVIMGGAFRVNGNISEHAEANIHNDPHAAAEVFAADWEIVMVGLDVTDTILCTEADFAEIKQISPNKGGFIEDMSKFYLEFYRSVDVHGGCSLHDPAAVIACAYPEWFEIVDAKIDVVLTGDKWGNTFEVPNANTTPVRVCVGVQIDTVKRHFIETFKVFD